LDSRRHSGFDAGNERGYHTDRGSTSKPKRNPPMEPRASTRPA